MLVLCPLSVGLCPVPSTAGLVLLSLSSWVSCVDFAVDFSWPWLLGLTSDLPWTFALLPLPPTLDLRVVCTAVLLLASEATCMSDKAADPEVIRDLTSAIRNLSIAAGHLSSHISSSSSSSAPFG